MKYIASILSVGLLLTGCGSSPTVQTSKAVDEQGLAIAALEKKEKLNFGDVEATVNIEVTVKEEDVPLGSSADELRAQYHKKLTSASADIKGLAPTSLMTNIFLKTKTDFTHTPVILRGKMLREIEIGKREEIYTFTTVIDSPTIAGGKAPMQPSNYDWEFKVDAFQGLSALPETMLLHVEAEAILLEPDTDLASLDIETFPGNIDNSGYLLSNPLRINYVPLVGNAPAAEAPATEAPATETPATETPATETPAAEAPATEAPATEAPATEAPATETPATETPATEAPATEAPATEAPATETPAA